MPPAAESTEQRRTVTLDGGCVSYLEWAGAGPAIHFAHANGFNAETYRALLAPLGSRYHLFASDARGHGFTTLPTGPGLAAGWSILRDDLAATLDALHPGPIILAGHSLGAVASLMVAASRPNRVRGLVLVEPVLVPADPKGLENPGPALVEMTRKRRTQFSSFDQVLNAYRGRGAFQSWPDEMLIDYLKGGLRNADGGVHLTCAPDWEAEIYSSTPLGTATLVERVTCPVTILYGEKNSSVPDREVRLLAQGGRCTLLQIPGTDHFLPMEKPQAVRAEIARLADLTNG